MEEIKQPLKRTEVLNLGYVELWDIMGDDTAIADAARTSYADATKRSNDRNLIRYMWANRHTSPFEQVVLKFRIKAPIMVLRQWIRHRTARLNEMSGRYSEMPEEYYDYCEQGLALQSQTNRQGSQLDTINLEDDFLGEINLHNQAGFKLYRELIAEGVSLELARAHLPVSTYSTIVWQMDLHNLFHFLSLRMDSHAQKEIRVYADAIYEMIKEYVPFSCEAFEDYTFNAVTFSRMELDIIKDHGDSDDATLGMLIEDKKYGLSKREQGTFVDKLKRIGLYV